MRFLLDIEDIITEKFVLKTQLIKYLLSTNDHPPLEFISN